MRHLRAWLLRFAGLFPGKRNDNDRELAAEIDSHLQMHADDNLRAGLSPEQARREALLKFGGVQSTLEDYRERNTIPLLENLLQDARYSLRQLAKAPGFTFTATLVLALGVCASVAIFAFVDAALLKPLPYDDPSRLVAVYESGNMVPHSNLSYLDYLDWKRANNVFASFDIWNGRGYLFSTSSGAVPVRGVRVTDGFFRTLGVTPLLGRDFYAGEDRADAQRTVILSYAAWQTRFGGSPDVIGQATTLSNTLYTIVGVLPPEFHFARQGRAEFWTTMHAAGDCDLRRSCHNSWGVARLKNGVSIQMATAAMVSIAQQLEKQYPDSNRGQSAAVTSLSDAIVGDVRPILLVLLSGAGLLLLIACVNVSSLLLVRSESRRREMAVREALGASPARLLRQFITEAFVLVALGAGSGVMLASMVMKLMLKLISADMMTSMPYLRGLGFNLHVATFAAIVALSAVILFSLTASLRLASSGMRASLAEGGRTAAGTTWRRFASNLVVLELVTAVVLLVGAGLLGRSFYRLMHIDHGFNPSQLATVDVGIPTTYSADEQVVSVTRQLVRNLEALPGVESVGIADRLVLTGNGNTGWIRFPGRPYHGEHNDANQRDVSSAYLSTLQAKLLRGRYFTDAEDMSKPRVAVINRALAEKYFPGEDPIGKTFGDAALSPKSIREIIGVVDDPQEGSLDADMWPAVYYPFNQSPDTFFSVVVRTSQAEGSVLPELVKAIHQLDPRIGTLGESTMIDRINDSQTAYLRRSSAWLVGGFAAAALLLAVVGLYGVIAYSVSQRTREIGVRMALGARPGTVYQLILKEAGRLTGLGIALGVACALAATTMLKGLLFGVSSWDAPTLAMVAVVLGTASLFASYIPARRAASLNPAETLRAE